MGRVDWGLPVVFYFFLTDTGAGAFFIAMLAGWTGIRKFRSINWVGGFVDPCPGAIGISLLVYDLGQPARFWRLIFRTGEGFLMLNPNSMMSIGVWVLSISIFVNISYALFTLVKWPTPWLSQKLRSVLGVIGFPWAIGVMIYTGVFLSVTSVPLWRSWVFPSIFLLSAICNGISICIFLICLGRIKDRAKTNASVAKLERINSRVLLFQVLTISTYLFLNWSKPSLQLVIGKNLLMGIFWWVGFVGLGVLLPMFFCWRRKIGQNPTSSLAVATCAILGGFWVRYVLLVGGQMIP
jgi:molybdopterin-containing oxidoreductase family membrane subunit